VQQKINETDKKVIAKISLDTEDIFLIKKLIANEITKYEGSRLYYFYVDNLKRLYNELKNIKQFYVTENDR
jgi:hypothetical protein